jgi:endoglucanase
MAFKSIAPAALLALACAGPLGATTPRDDRPLAPGDFVHARDFARGALRGFTLDENRHTEDDFRAFAATGANLARLMIPTKRCPTCSTYTLGFDREYIDFVVRMGAKYGFRVVVNLVVHPSNTRAEYWQREDLRASLAAIWTELAARYADSPVIAGFDLVNEPNSPARTREGKVEDWMPLAARLLEAVRKVDRRHAVIVAFPGVFWQSAPLMKPLPDDNVVYTFHMYDPMEVTHQGLYQYAPGREYPSRDMDRKRLWGWFLAPMKQFADRYQVPLYVGEFSCIRWAPAGTPERYLTDLLEFFEAQGWAWTYHAFRGYRGWNAELAGGPKEAVLARGTARDFSPDTEAMQVLRERLARNRAR